jgi:hypothetical protein
MGQTMAFKGPAPRAFISFAIEDSNLRDFLVGQARNSKTPFEFQDFSVKAAWDSSWKTNCRTKIRGCDAVIGLITKNTIKADGQIWELQCAYEEGVPTLLIYGNSNDRPAYIPQVVQNKRILDWTWNNIGNFLAGI